MSLAPVQPVSLSMRLLSWPTVALSGRLRLSVFLAYTTRSVTSSALEPLAAAAAAGVAVAASGGAVSEAVSIFWGKVGKYVLSVLRI